MLSSAGAVQGHRHTTATPRLALLPILTPAITYSFSVLQHTDMFFRSLCPQVLSSGTGIRRHPLFFLECCGLGGRKKNQAAGAGSGSGSGSGSGAFTPPRASIEMGATAYDGAGVEGGKGGSGTLKLSPDEREVRISWHGLFDARRFCSLHHRVLPPACIPRFHGGFPRATFPHSQCVIGAGNTLITLKPPVLSLIFLPQDVRAERLRVEALLQSGDTSSSSIVVRDLRKVFPPQDGGKPKVAVRTLTLGIERGECFGLLGPNGAGGGGRRQGRGRGWRDGAHPHAGHRARGVLRPPGPERRRWGRTEAGGGGMGRTLMLSIERGECFGLLGLNGAGGGGRRREGAGQRGVCQVIAG